MKFLAVIFIFVGFCSIFSCHHSDKMNTICAINGENIENSAIDQIIEQDLYDDLYHIYFVRKSAAEELLSLKALDLCAKRRKISRDSLIDEYLRQKLNDSLLNIFIQERNLNNGIPLIQNGELSYLEINSTEGKEQLNKEFRKYITQKLSDSLCKVYNAQIFIRPPLAPYKSLDSLHSYFRGRKISDIKITTIANYDCEICKEHHSIMSKLFKLYGSKIKFEYSNFSTSTSPAAKASICAGYQDKYFEMDELLMSSKRNLDSIDVFNLALDLNLDMDQFKADYSDPSTKLIIKNNNEYLFRKGFSKTPTLLINNRMVHDLFNFDELNGRIMSLLSN